MDGVLQYVNYKGHSSSKKPLGAKEEWLVVVPKVLRRMRKRPRHLSPDPQQKRYQEVEYESQDMDDD